MASDAVLTSGAHEAGWAAGLRAPKHAHAPGELLD